MGLPIAGVISWNWDNVLDQHCHVMKCEAISKANTGEGDNAFEAFMDILRDRKSGSHETGARKPPLLKLQGDLDDAPTVVVSDQDYKDIADRRGPFLKNLYAEFQVLHIGLGLGNIDGESWARIIGTPPHKHFAIMNDVDEARRQWLLERRSHIVINYDSKATKWQGNKFLLDAIIERLA